MLQQVGRQCVTCKHHSWLFIFFHFLEYCNLKIFQYIKYIKFAFFMISKKRNKIYISATNKKYFIPTCPIPIIPIFFCLMSVEFLRTLLIRVVVAEANHFVLFWFNTNPTIDCLTPKTDLHDIIMLQRFLKSTISFL